MFGSWKTAALKSLCTITLSALSLGLTHSISAKTDLAFIVDGSGSISNVDWNIQRNGIVAALQDPLITPRDGSVAVTVVQFSSTTRVEFPYRTINSEADVQAAIAAVQSMNQFGQSTGSGSGIVATTNHLLSNNVLEMDFQSFCMSTDGTTNSGPSVGSAISNAQLSDFVLDRYSVIAIEDPPNFDQNDADLVYGPHVFGGGDVLFVSNFTEFASFVGALCLGEPLKLVGMEVTQVIQDLENNVALVEDKATIVRTYIEPGDGVDPVRATARLIGTRGGQPLPDSPLTAINTGGSIIARPDALSRRNILSDSLNFRLPTAWQNGAVELELQAVGGTLDCNESAGPAPNDCKTTVIFNTGAELEVKFLKVKYSDGGSTVEASNNDLNELERRLLATFPTASIDRTSGTLDMGAGIPAVDELLSQLQTMRFLDLCWSVFSCDRLYYGAVNQGGMLLSSNGNSTGGKANGIPGSVSAGVMVDGNSYGRNRHGHEIAHTMGRHHAASASDVGTEVSGSTTYKKGPCNSFARLTAPDFPNIFNVGGIQRATLGPMESGDDKLVFGWDDQRGQVVDPNSTFAMMSYCSGFRWPSDFTYEGIRGYINANFSTTEPPVLTKSGAQSWQLVRGIIDRNAAAIEFKPLLGFQVDATITPPGLPGDDYALIAYDANDNELERTEFTPIEMEDDPLNAGGSGSPGDNTAYMIIPVVYNPDTVRFAVEDGDGNAISGQLVANDSDPEVTVTFPNGGEQLNPPSATFTWNASDADGDTLSYTVQISLDGGQTWDTLVTDHPDTSLDVQLEDLGASTQALLRVQASDGFNTAQDQSDGTFVTPNSPPNCDITKPEENASFVGVQPIILEAFTSDVEDGAISNVQWSSSIDGNIGNGLLLFTELGTGSVNGVRRLSEGTHVLTMTCTDGGGLPATDVVTIQVSLTQAIIKGDADSDGDVDRNDLSLIREDLNSPVDGSSCGARCDMNDDGIINALDMRLAALACTRPGCAIE